jgi:hypothetical protein
MRSTILLDLLDRPLTQIPLILQLVMIHHIRGERQDLQHHQQTISLHLLQLILLSLAHLHALLHLLFSHRLLLPLDLCLLHRHRVVVVLAPDTTLPSTGR